MSKPRRTDNLHSEVPSTRVLDENDAARFAVAADKYVAANTSSAATAKAKLMKLGFIDSNGKPTKPYR
jgi:hypothetical protein